MLLFVIEHLQNHHVHGIVGGIDGRNQHLFRTLPETVDTSVTLLHTVGVPRQVVVDDSLKPVLQVHAFRKAICAYQHMFFGFRKLIDLVLALLVGHSAGDYFDGDFFVFARRKRLFDLGPQILCGLDILAEHNGILAKVKTYLDVFQGLVNLVIQAEVHDALQVVDKALKLASLGLVGLCAIELGRYVSHGRQVLELKGEFVFLAFVDVGFLFVHCFVALVQFVAEHADARRRA